MKILGVVSARPNFVKMAPVVRGLLARGADAFLVHTGQHFDPEMSQAFFADLELPAPRVNLGLGSLSSWVQSGRIVEQLGELIAAESPDWVVVPGDVNGTLAAALAAIRAGARLAHLESGLRSFDRRMPEELNRIAVDHLADRLYVTEDSGLRNLRREGIPESRLRFVGNTMVDTLVAARPAAALRDPRKRLGLPSDQGFLLMTMHRPETVDSVHGLGALLDILGRAGRFGPVVFPVHPRTRRRIAELHLGAAFAAIRGAHLIEPLGYLDFLALTLRARLVLTDSGGLQEETTALGIPCLTLRPGTERPVTSSLGTNRVVGTDPAVVGAAIEAFWNDPPKPHAIEGWDGRAGERVAEDLLNP